MDQMNAVTNEASVSSQDGSTVHCIDCSLWIVLNEAELAEFNRGVGCVALLSLVLAVSTLLLIHAFSIP